MPLFAIIGELGCHSEDTRVLTPEGIKDWRELKVGDKVLGVDKTFRIVEATIKRVFTYDYFGPMFHFYSNKYDFLVTPNHRMLFSFGRKTYFNYIDAFSVFSNGNGLLPYYEDGKVCIESFSSKKNSEIKNYNGKVWCFETTTGNFFTVRNGKIGLSGNSGKTLSAVYLAVRNYNKFEEEWKRIEERKKELEDTLEELKKIYERNPKYFEDFVHNKLKLEKEEAIKNGDYGLITRLEILEQEIKENGARAYIDFFETELEFIKNKYEKRKIYSNIMLYDIWFYKLNTISELNWARNGFVLLDELWSAGLDARMSKRKKNIVTANILGKSRKRSLTIVFTVQTLRQLDSRIRDVLDFVAYPVMNSDGSICRLYIWRGNKPKGRPLKVLRFFTEDVYKHYNSREEVPELIDDTDDEGLGEKEPEYMFVPSTKNPAWVEYLVRKRYGVKKLI
ncbi:hypothetical protein DRN69_00315 [Candidatus Pacearchaeota archaeon]|nr:MAG: hypothetical protein DRN69_00315 [Candidatus Pacearchaeota archaeon]